MTEFGIEVRGLDEMRRDLRNIDDQLGKELGKVNKQIGQKVVDWTANRRSQMAAQFPSYNSDVVKVKPSANQRRVEVKIRPQAAERGTLRHPVFGEWMDQSSFTRKVWPAPNREGWLVRPTLDERHDMIADDYLEAVTRLLRETIGD